jgi:hypothetical protein
LPVLGASVALLLVFDLTRHLVLVLLLVGAAWLSLPWAARRLDATSEPAGRAILLGALLLRLPLLPLPPTLSDDVLRYLWDGRVAAAGRNPYLLPPAAPELTPLRDDLWRRLPHRQIPTVYPPLAVAAFSIAARLPFPILSWKLLVTGADLAACAILLRMARQLGLPAGRTIWYAWNPLVALEVAGHGHVDILGVAAALAVVSILLARRVPWGDEEVSVGFRPEGPGGSRPFGVQTAEKKAAGEAIAAQWRSSRIELRAPLPTPPGETPPKPGRGRWIALAGIAAACGILAKLAPAAALPMWGRQSGRPKLFWLCALGLTATAILPVVVAAGGIPPGLVTYSITWDWNGPLFEPLWRLIAAAGVAGRLAAALDAYKTWRQEWYRLNWIYPYLYPQLLAKIVLAGVSLAAVARSWREKEPVAGSGRLFGTLLLASATVYPWYLLWVLPWAALTRHPAWLALSGLVMLSYLGPVLGIPLWPWIWLAIWGPFYVLFFWSWKRRPWSIA